MSQVKGFQFMELLLCLAETSTGGKEGEKKGFLTGRPRGGKGGGESCRGKAFFAEMNCPAVWGKKEGRLPL